MPIASLTKLMTAMVVIDSKRSLVKPNPLASWMLMWSASIGRARAYRSARLHITLMSSENRAAFALSRDHSAGRASCVR